MYITEISETGLWAHVRYLAEGRDYYGVLPEADARAWAVAFFYATHIQED